MAVAVVATVPMALLPNVVPNQFISGFTLGAVKG